MKKIVILFMMISVAVVLISCSKEDDSKIDINNDSVYEVFDDTFEGDWNMPGLYQLDGSSYTMPIANRVAGETIDVLDFGAKADDPDFDNTDAFRNAIESASEGDEVYVPAGSFYFSSFSSSAGGYRAHINLQSFINFRGAGENQTFLVSNFDPSVNEDYSTTVIISFSEESIKISDLTVTSVATEMPDEDDSSNNNENFDGPKYGITIGNDIPNFISQNITIENVTVEKFRRMGVRIVKSRAVTLDSMTFKNALDLGGGGHGYGVSIQGQANGLDYTDTNVDTLFNVVKNSTFEGPYLRHGVIVQYYAHNNLITNNNFENLLLDSVDLHGEDEYSNEISYNTITNTRRGAAIGVGNSGATHDAAGRNNLIQHNIIEGGQRGIDVLYGSPSTVIYKNEMANLEASNATGILIENGPQTKIVGNTIKNILGEDAYGIKVMYAYDSYNPSNGIPDGLMISNNTLESLNRGVYIEAHTEIFVMQNNTFNQNVAYDLLDENDSFVLPGIDSVVIEKSGVSWLPTDDNFITKEMPDGVQTQKNMKFKGSTSEVPYNRMIYIKFDLTDAPTSHEHVYLKFAAKGKDGKTTFNIYGSDTYTNWTEDTITWNNSLFHEEDYARISYDEQTDDLVHITDFSLVTIGSVFVTYYIDITDYVRSIEDNEFTIIMSNDDLEGYYSEVYSKEQTAVSQQLMIVFSNED
jgi:hypothetical protein